VNRLYALFFALSTKIVQKSGPAHIKNAKTKGKKPIKADWRGKNRLAGDFWGFYARSATDC
jgi:hypothetical protein